MTLPGGFIAHKNISVLAMVCKLTTNYRFQLPFLEYLVSSVWGLSVPDSVRLRLEPTIESNTYVVSMAYP